MSYVLKRGCTKCEMERDTAHMPFAQADGAMEPKSSHGIPGYLPLKFTTE